VSYQPQMTHAGLSPIHSVQVWDEQGRSQTVAVAGEKPLTLRVNHDELITLMTFGTYPEALAIGYLRNQGLIKQLEEITTVQVDWQSEVVKIQTLSHWQLTTPTSYSAMTTCGQGAVLSTQRHIPRQSLPNIKLKQSVIYTLLANLTQYHQTHHQVGGVHSCALCQTDHQILAFIEDVGRHNAVDTIAGLMWLHHWNGEDKIFYTTGRLNAEIVMKIVNMGISILLSRSGVTYHGIKLAQQYGVTLIAHAKEQHFLIFNGNTNIIFDTGSS
jgi:FdhD protein